MRPEPARRAVWRKLTFLLPFLAPACAPEGPRVREAAEVGTIEQSPAIVGRDGGGSEVVFGQSVWSYGDTVLAELDAEGRNWHHNSYSMTTDFDASDGIGGFYEPPDAANQPREWFPPTEEEAAYNALHFSEDCEEPPCNARWAVWPGTPNWDEERQRALVVYGVIHLGDDDPPGGGQSIAVWSDPDALPVRPILRSEGPTPDVMWAPDEGSWGTATTIDGDFMYAFSCDEGGLSRPCRLGRGPLEEVQDREAWRYWDGADWSAEMDDAIVLFDGAPILSLAWNDYLEAWLAMYSPPFAGCVKARTAPALTGPWSAEADIYKVPGDSPYDANHHPEYAEEGGRVEYVTFSRHTEGWFGAEMVLVRVEFQ